MVYDPKKHHRRSIRLRGYDYAAPGVYFVTLCTSGRKTMFGRVVGGEVVLNHFGRVAAEEWRRSAAVRPGIILDAFVVMPNHIHGIIILTAESQRAIPEVVDLGANSGAPLRRRNKSLGSFVAGYKAVVTKRINEIRGTPRAPVWQRNYYERVIRDDRELGLARVYIQDNPARWPMDKYYVR